MGQCSNYCWPWHLRHFWISDIFEKCWPPTPHPPIGYPARQTSEMAYLHQKRPNFIQNGLNQSRSPWEDIKKGIFAWENTKKWVFSFFLDCVSFDNYWGLKTDSFFARSIIALLSFLQIAKLQQCNTNIFKYSNIWYRILDIRIWILNFLVTNIFDIRIRPIC